MDSAMFICLTNADFTQEYVNKWNFEMRLIVFLSKFHIQGSDTAFHYGSFNTSIRTFPNSLTN